MIIYILQIIFWISIGGIFYAYIGYPIFLTIINKLNKNNKVGKYIGKDLLKVSIVIPFHNEEKNLPKKIQNLLDLNYPKDLSEIIFVSDGSTDKSDEIVKQHLSENLHHYRMEKRKGKAAALNLGVNKSQYEIIIFTDASIILENDAVKNIIKDFINPKIGCISGEDFIPGNSGEGFYGRYELLLRNLESDFSSIVGASGSFYAQRRELIEEFLPGMAPDFLSVLATVEKGFRAITEPLARGEMRSVKSTSQEFSRKVRTLIRGMAALFYKKKLLNIFQYPAFAFSLISHKICRWLVPWFMILAIISNIFLMNVTGYYQIFFYMQLIFYCLIIVTTLPGLHLGKTLPGKMSLFFVISNLAVLFAWFKFWSGDHQEIWQPTARN